MPDQEPVHVLITTSLSDALLKRVKESAPDVAVSDGAGLLLQENPEALRPGQEPAPLRTPGRSFDELLAQAEVMLSARRLPARLLRRAPGLRWVQLPMAGINWLAGTDLWAESRIAITGATGVNAAPVAEHVMATMMALFKNLRRMIRSQEAGRWDRFTGSQARDKTMGIVGYGAIGRALAPMAQGLGMRVLATKRRVSPGEGLPDWVVPAERLDWLLAESDVVVLAVPATADTERLIGASQIAAMRPAAILVNIARGDVVDEPALIDALDAGRIAGAALDVFDREPLPPGSPMWQMPNVIVSGHIAGLFEDYDGAVVDLFIANLRRYLAGEPLMNEVDRERGY